MERPPYIVDGVDFSAYVNRWQYAVGYDFREGKNGGLMLDGSEPRDLLAIKARVSVTVRHGAGGAAHRGAQKRGHAAILRPPDQRHPHRHF